MMKRLKNAADRLIRLIFRPKREIMYINGPENLPPPIPKEQETEIFARLAAGDGAARELLITHNLRLVVYIAKKFENTGVGIEDLISIGTVGLIKAVGTFCPDKNIKLATYASRCIENEILMYLRKTSNRRQELSIDEPLSADPDGNELMLSDIIGTESDSIYRGIEQESENRVLAAAVSRLAAASARSSSCASAFSAGASTPRKRWPTASASRSRIFRGLKSASSASCGSASRHSSDAPAGGGCRGGLTATAAQRP